MKFDHFLQFLVETCYTISHLVVLYTNLELGFWTGFGPVFEVVLILWSMYDVMYVTVCFSFVTGFEHV